MKRVRTGSLPWFQRLISESRARHTSMDFSQVQAKAAGIKSVKTSSESTSMRAPYTKKSLLSMIIPVAHSDDQRQQESLRSRPVSGAEQRLSEIFPQSAFPQSVYDSSEANGQQPSPKSDADVDRFVKRVNAKIHLLGDAPNRSPHAFELSREIQALAAQMPPGGQVRVKGELKSKAQLEFEADSLRESAQQQLINKIQSGQARLTANLNGDSLRQTLAGNYRYLAANLAQLEIECLHQLEDWILNDRCPDDLSLRGAIAKKASQLATSITVSGQAVSLAGVEYNGPALKHLAAQLWSGLGDDLPSYTGTVMIDGEFMNAQSMYTHALDILPDCSMAWAGLLRRMPADACVRHGDKTYSLGCIVKHVRAIIPFRSLPYDLKRFTRPLSAACAIRFTVDILKQRQPQCLQRCRQKNARLSVLLPSPERAVARQLSVSRYQDSVSGEQLLRFFYDLGASQLCGEDIAKVFDYNAVDTFTQSSFLRPSFSQNSFSQNSFTQSDVSDRPSSHHRSNSHSPPNSHHPPNSHSSV